MFLYIYVHVYYIFYYKFMLLYFMFNIVQLCVYYDLCVLDDELLISVYCLLDVISSKVEVLLMVLSLCSSIYIIPNICLWMCVDILWWFSVCFGCGDMWYRCVWFQN